jgi:putative transposase
MPRANRISCRGFVWHITHRCHKRSFLLKFAKDRKHWRHWLFVARRRYGLSVLNYIVTSNHVHLLVVDQGHNEIAAAIQLIASRTAQEFNRRKNRRGAFWEDRYHATAVQTDEHLARCMTYIDLNMVRAGAVKMPAEWDVSGYLEIQRPWKRKGVIDFSTLCRLSNVTSVEQLARHRHTEVTEALNSSSRNPAWTEAVGVGDEAFLCDLRLQLGARGLHRNRAILGQTQVLKETLQCYLAISVSKTDN